MSCFVEHCPYGSLDWYQQGSAHETCGDAQEAAAELMEGMDPTELGPSKDPSVLKRWELEVPEDEPGPQGLQYGYVRIRMNGQQHQEEDWSEEDLGED